MTETNHIDFSGIEKVRGMFFKMLKKFGKTLDNIVKI